MIKGTQEPARDSAEEHLQSVASRPERALITFAKLLYPNLSEEKLMELFAQAQDTEETDSLMQDVVRRGLKGSLDKQANIDRRKG